MSREDLNKSLTVHSQKLAVIEELPRPLNRDDAGSEQYRRDAIRILQGWLLSSEVCI